MNGRTNEGVVLRWGLCGALLLGCGPTISTRQRLADLAKATVLQNESLVRRAAGEGSESISFCANHAQVSQLAENAFEVRLCGLILEYTRDGRGGFDYPMRPAAARAAEELRCPIESLQPVRASAAVRVIEGCGRRVTFDLVCPDICSWQRRSIERVSPPADGEVVLDRVVVPNASPAPQGSEPPRGGDSTTTPVLPAPGGQ